MGFKNKTNRVHSTTTNKRQERKDSKLRKLAGQIHNPFSCCTTGDSVLDNVYNQELYIIDNSCKDFQITRPQRNFHWPSPSQRDSRSHEKVTTPYGNLNNIHPRLAKSPKYPSTALTTPSTTSNTIFMTPVGSDHLPNEDEDYDDSHYPPKNHSKFVLPVHATSTVNYSRLNKCPRLPPLIRQSAPTTSCLQTNYQPSSVALQGDLIPHVMSFPSLRPSFHQQLPYCKMVQESFAYYFSDSDESGDSLRAVVGEECESSSDFDDCFEPTNVSLSHCQPRDDSEKTDCLSNRPESTEDQTNYSYNGQQQIEDQLYDGESCSSPEKDVEYFPGEEGHYLPLIKTSLRCLRGWLLPPSIHQRAVQPNPPLLLDDEKPIMSSAINHTLLVISYYTNNLQSGVVFRGEQCPYFVEGMFCSVIKFGNTVHLENYDSQHKVSANEAFTLLKTKYEALYLEWNTASTINHTPAGGMELADEGGSDGLPMAIYCPQSNDTSLAYHISKLDVNACEALMYTFKEDSMVFVPTGDGRILLLDQHAHDTMDGGAIITMCPSSMVPIQDMLNDYHLEYHELNYNVGHGIKFSYMNS